MEWRHSGLPRPKIFRVQKSAGKFLSSIFWDQDGILLIDHLPKGQTISGVLLISAGAIEGHFEGKTQQEVHQRCLVLARQCPGSPDTWNPNKLAYLGFQCLDHSLYSPDLTPSDYHLSPGLKKQLKGRLFSS
jgi:histone-lysine N-methyltransferase SETMAR